MPPTKRIAGNVFDDSAAFLALACDAMTSAAQEAKEENDRLGLPTPSGGPDGNIRFSTPRLRENTP